jgi:hypothetical protein
MKERNDQKERPPPPSLYLPAHLREWYYYTNSSWLFFQVESEYTHTLTVEGEKKSTPITVGHPLSLFHPIYISLSS